MSYNVLIMKRLLSTLTVAVMTSQLLAGSLSSHLSAQEITQEVIVQPELAKPSRLLLTSLYAANGALEVFDYASTRSALASGGVEANPVMGGLVAHPALFLAVKVGISVATIGVAEHCWRKGHRGTAIALMAITNGMLA